METATSIVKTRASRKTPVATMASQKHSAFLRLRSTPRKDELEVRDRAGFELPTPHKKQLSVRALLDIYSQCLCLCVLVLNQCIGQLDVHSLPPSREKGDLGCVLHRWQSLAGEVAVQPWPQQTWRLFLRRASLFGVLLQPNNWPTFSAIAGIQKYRKQSELLLI